MEATPVKPNIGATVPDVVAVGKANESQRSWLEKQKINRKDRIHLKKLSHMRYQHPDLEETHRFMTHFGMQVAKKVKDEIWYRGYGSDQYVYYARKGPKQFLGGTFEALSQEDFNKAASLPTASPVQDLSDAPGGGFLVTITDPEGFPFNVAFGQKPIDAGVKHPEQVVLNYTGDKARRREFNRFEPGPAGVHKLGHFGLCTQQFDELVKFYTSTFNLVPTDLLYIEKDGHKKNVSMFAHIDLGDTLTDHHSFFLSASPGGAHVHHCSFEVHDFDTQHLGHQWLAQRGYNSVWGIGRHVLGSQIFDYWWDTTGNMIEHYADGDLVNRDTPIGYVQAGSESLAVWGPEVPATFLE
ncbi:Glyoxalase/Bleomycin resistance protein/Dihydroxybiphenyl dioxygenase [Penicillium concentricum]|uniref:Glyoxalase/Bleomycin resistance protein/Dihydroxybiphenyl dioxygenase n=1 Tax=Penicillium concentricum TaxID=293559 RepID=A0A9W9V3K4_9EURO|nr:Glyoxalase/Bleomycin resistance protein/Dihydroxybiphenyl dioxygenase [Penicillium concentricum]KAJ5365230.1 Glyoxalase/Bleomycin resistance protein/Dihydroxybiphenyl dioxygenase [Penicillium concentricum]